MDYNRSPTIEDCCDDPELYNSLFIHTSRKSNRVKCYVEFKNRISKMIELKLDINAPNDFGRTIMMEVCAFRFMDLIKYLLKHRADMNITDTYGYTALHYYGTNFGDLAIEELYKNDNCFDELCKPTDSPLLYVLKDDDIDSIKFMIEHNAKITDGVINELDKNDISKYYDLIMNHYQMAQTSKRLDFLNDVNKAIETKTFDIPDKNGRTTLMYVCINKCYNMIRKLITLGANIYAVDNNRISCQRYLVLNTFDMKIHNANSIKSPLRIAIEQKNMLEVLILINEFKYKINEKEHDGNTPLMAASVLDQYEIVNILLENKADVSANNEGFNALMCASNNYMISKLLIQHKANVNSVSENGSTPLMCSMSQKNPSTLVIDLLLEHGADPFFENKNKVSAYSIASSLNDHCLSIITKYVFKNDDKKNENQRHDDKEPTQQLQTSSIESLFDAISKKNEVFAKYYIERVSDLYITDDYGKNALILSCECGLGEVAVELIFRQLDVLIMDIYERDALYYAIVNTHRNKSGIDIVQALLENKADPNRQYDGINPLMLACRKNKHKLIFNLLKCGADPNTKDISGKTAFMIAKSYNAKECIDILMKCGIKE